MLWHLVLNQIAGFVLLSEGLSLNAVTNTHKNDIIEDILTWFTITYVSIYIVLSIYIYKCILYYLHSTAGLF